MIKSFRIENHLGESIELDIRRPEDTGFLVASVTGLNYPKIDFSEQKFSNYDGSFYGGQHVQARNIVLNIVFYENNKEKLDVESLRWKLQRLCIVKNEIKFYVTNDHGTFWIKGYIESNEINIFSSREAAQISILCPDPYFIKDSDEQIAAISLYDPMFEFEFSAERESPITTDYTTEEQITPSPHFSTNADDYYEVELSKYKKGYALSFIEGTEKLEYKNIKNKEGGYTFQAELPNDYSKWVGVSAQHVHVSTAVNEAGGYTAKADYTDNSIEFGRIKNYPATIIDYDGSAVTGVKIIIEPKSYVSGICIHNATRNEVITINDEKLMSIVGYLKKYDQIIINTTQGEKSAILIRDGLTYNIFKACMPVKKWIQLQTGPNVISYSSTTDLDLLDVKISYLSRYLGV